MIQVLYSISLCAVVVCGLRPVYESLNTSYSPSSGKFEKTPEKEASLSRSDYYSSHDESDKIFSGYSFSKVENASENGGLIVKCGEKSWRIVVKRKYFGRGLPFSPRAVRLGEDGGAAAECRPQTDFLTASQMIISAGLQDCGSESWVNGDWLIYSNKLVFASGAFLTLDGVLLFKRTPSVVPIECHYKRRFRVSAEPLSPTWLPMTSTIEAAGLLHFSLHVVKDGSGSAHQSTHFQQGEPLLLEAAVYAPLHPPLRIFVDNCVATANSDPLSKPSYEFISNHGCLVDSLLPNSSSKYYNRPKENVLRFSIPAFSFPQDQRKQVFISCHLRAAPHNSPSDSLNKACYFHGPSFSWHSIEGNNIVCLCCETEDCMAGKMDSSSLYLGEERTAVDVGPLQILPTNSHSTGKLTIGDVSLT
ncbi:hypothetical protein MHYP_G00011600 [Metynnis hypsauchen]